MASMIAKAVKCMMFLMVPLLSTIPAISKDWLGDYKGGVVPGYEVRASVLSLKCADKIEPRWPGFRRLSWSM
jgi:hypothetical protein